MALPIAPIAPLAISSPGAATAPASGASQGSGGFGKALTDSIEKLNQGQTEAAQQTQALATGQATDISSVVMSVQKASLEMQFAVQVRNKVIDAYNEIFRMQV